MKITQTVLSLALVLASLTVAQTAGADFSEFPKQAPKNLRLDPKYFQIGMVQVSELSTETLDSRNFDSNGAVGSATCAGRRMNRINGNFDGAGDWIGEVGSQVDQIDMIVDKVINIGKKIWAVVEKGRPVVNVRADVATALPSGARCWQDLQTWRAPVAKTWGVSFKNLYGMEVVKYVYRVVYLAGGTVDGVGQYIGYATVQPVELNVAWGYTFNSEATVPTVYNMGTRSNPVGGMNIEVQWSVETVLKKTVQTQSYTIDGRGNFAQLK